MPKQIHPKIVALTFGILVISFLAAFYVVAWQEPTLAPPGGNVATPLNVSSVGQIKTGNLVVNALGISGTSGNLFSMPTGAGTGKVLTSDASGMGSWSAAGVIPSGMIAMFDTACPSGWTRFTALDDKFPLGSATYSGVPGGSSSHTHTASAASAGDHAHLAPVPTETIGSRVVSITAHPGPWGSGTGPWSGKYWTTTGTSYQGEWTTYMYTSSAGDHTHAVTVNSASTLPPFLGVVWCKKN